MFLEPPFLRGTFLSHKLGFQFATSPPIDLLLPSSLTNENPFIVVAAALEHAKKGDFNALRQVTECLQDSWDVELWDDSASLLGHACPAQFLRAFLETFRELLYVHKHLTIQTYACEILSRSLQLWAIPIMLDLYCDREDLSEASDMPLWFSELLEPKIGGPISIASLPADEYQDLVIRKYNDLCDRYGTSSVPVVRGELFSVCRTAERLLTSLKAENLEAEEVPSDRMLFEASTGIDCRGFYNADGDLNPLTGAKIIEEFLDDPSNNKYETGMRYFFGHRIPD